jgi:ferritin-like metal-binding protein YciE
LIRDSYWTEVNEMAVTTTATGTSSSETMQTIFIGSLRNTHALEKEARQLLQRQVERSGDFPEVEQMLRRHLDETNQQEERIDEILHSLGEDRSMFKDIVTQLMGNMAALAHAPASDEILKNAFANNAFENYEIAAYKSLITIAEAAGQSRYVPALRQTLQEEERMAQWCAENIENLTRKYLMREEQAAR